MLIEEQIFFNFLILMPYSMHENEKFMSLTAEKSTFLKMNEIFLPRNEC
jgi:hypothetical protein